MIVEWALEAELDRDSIMHEIAADNPLAAIRMDDLFSEGADRLSQFPLLGRIGRCPGTRELVVHESYQLVYEIDDDAIRILAVVHTARMWPPLES